MRPVDIDRLLADNEEIPPSSGFEASVMQAVLQEATAPPPLAFPWRRALPGFMALLAVFAVAIWNGIGALNDPSAGAVFDDQVRALLDFVARGEFQWIAITVVMTIVSAVVPLHLMRGRM